MFPQYDWHGLAQAIEKAIHDFRLRNPEDYLDSLGRRRIAEILKVAEVAESDAMKTAEETDWPQIAALYEGLQRWLPNPVIALNHAVAVAMVDGPEAGLARLAALAEREELDDYRYFHAAQADLLRRAGKVERAAKAYERALKLAENDGERRFLLERIASLGDPEADG